MKSLNLRNIGINEREESQLNGLDKMFNKIMEKFPETKEKYTHTATRSTEYTKIDKTRKENPHYLSQLKHYIYRTNKVY